MKRHVAMFAFALLLSGGSLHIQEAKQEKEAKTYMMADAHLDTQWNSLIREFCFNTESRVKIKYS